MIQGHFRDAMEGTWYSLSNPGVEQTLSFSTTATITRPRQLWGAHDVPLEGWIRVDGLVGDVPCTGTIGVGSLVRERWVPYTLDFRSKSGERFRLFGEKEVSLVTPLRSLGAMAAYLYNERGDEIGRAVLRAKPGEGPLDFVRSWRLQWRR